MYGTPGDDVIETQWGATTSFCGFDWDSLNLEFVTIGGTPFEQRVQMWGDEGNDILWSESNGPAYLDGGWGADFLFSDRSDGFFFGGADADELFISGPGNGGTISGDGGQMPFISIYEGDDWLRLEASTGTPQITTCGGGTGDAWCGIGTRPSDCEFTVCPM